MNSGVDVKRLQALRDLNASICDFSQTIDAHIRDTRAEFNKTLEWIAERKHHWQGEERRCGAALHAAQRAYDVCLSLASRETRSAVMCNVQANAVRQAKSDLAKSRQELQNVLRWENSVKTKAHDFMGQAVRLRNLTNQTLSQASTFLREKVAVLDPYASRGMQSPLQLASLSAHGADYRKAKREMLLRSLDDPLVGRSIKGWIRNELRRIDHLRQARVEGRPLAHPNSTNIRMPPGLDAGHGVWGMDTAANLRFEGIYENRSRYHRASRLGIEDRIR